MASYGCLHKWAGLLGNPEAAALLEEILGEKKAANETLTARARASSNEEALGKSGRKQLTEDSAKIKPANLPGLKAYHRQRVGK